MRISDWSSDVCSSDLFLRQEGAGQPRLLLAALPDRHPIGFLAHIAEAHPVKRRDRPLARRGFAVAAGGARPDLGRQPFGDRPGGIVALLSKIDGARWLKGEEAGGGQPGGHEGGEAHKEGGGRWEE